MAYQKETKKEAILKAAKTLFWRHGLRRVSIVEICNSANVSKMTFYKYFANKEVLAEYLITEMLTDWHNEYRSVMNSDLDFTAKINQVIALEQKASQNMSEEFLADIYNNEVVHLQQLIKTYRDGYHSEIVKDMIEAQKNGQVRADIKPEFILYLLEDIGHKVMDEKLSKLYPSKQALVMELTNYFFMELSTQQMKILPKTLRPLLVLFCLCFITVVQAQHSFEFDGQASAYGSFSPDNKLNFFAGGRYLPELNYGYTFSNTTTLDFEASANMYASVLFHPFDSAQTEGDIRPYRFWGRYVGKQFELRAGLQKIDFGAATMLRPLQWFDEIDPRDPLQFTTGVYGILGRYYFLNNANIWAWVLYGNENQRGFELLKNNSEIPEFGGRVQLPVPRGEIAATYHHRNAFSEANQGFPVYDNIPENRFALDGKWDVEVGLWFEAVHINKSKDLGMLTNQSYLTLGTDYTFGVGNGLTVAIENMLSTFDEKAFTFENTSNMTATSLSYPVGFFDNISAMLYYSWSSEDFSFFLNYEHQFKKFTGYIMAYYNPENQTGFGTIRYENSFSGPGIRLMLVYNH